MVNTALSEQQQVERDKAELRDAWDDLITELQAARDTIDNPERFPPEATTRVLAEGYRYLAGFIHHGIERSFHEDPNFPAFRNALSVFNKSTIENSDAIYFYAPIDGRQRYLVQGKVKNWRHWRGEARVKGEALAPQYLIFEVSSGNLVGDTGDLRELMPGTKTGFGTLDSSTLQVGENGELQLLLAPEKPDGYTGNFICTRKSGKSDDATDGYRYASYVSGRQLFYDWEHEEAVPLTITPLDKLGEHPPALMPSSSAAHLRHMGAVIRGQMHFWMKFYDKVLNCNGTYDPSAGGPYFMPVNSYNNPNAASGETGGGMRTNIYAGGIYDLAEGEALYVEATFTGDPVYVGFHLGNLWGESPDYANHQSSLNLFQMYMGEDGIQRWVVSHRDPGVKNWLDTTGIPRGYLSHRWAYAEFPPEENWPTITAKKIRFEDIETHFPPDMPRVSPAQRKAEIAIRQAHVQRRFRVF